LDGYCGQGGAGEGYARAGWKVVGIDIKPQKRYPHEFILGDFLALNPGWIAANFDAVHASPQCQRYSIYAKNLGIANRFPDSVPPTRRVLEATGLPYVMENVPGAPLRADLILCGSAFDLKVIRHRLFECNWSISPFTLTCDHSIENYGVYGNGTPSWHRAKLGRNILAADWREAMGIDWMTKEGLKEAIPPAYTEWIGKQLRAVLEVAA
jgi:DNA (cytosine-5)-methyltransferase 1